MINDITEYIKQINLLYQTGKARELSYRSALEQLIKKCTGFKVIGEQARSEFGTPDLALIQKDITIAFIETKDIGDGDLDGQKKNKAQFDKYKEAVDTIVFTDYLDFHLYKEGSLILHAELATIKDDKIVLNEDSLGEFESLINKLRFSAPLKISSPRKLAQLMADKAKLIASSILKELDQDIAKKEKLWGQLESFRKVLNKGLTEDEFADLYAQTIAYGLFAARIHDTSKKEFTRLRAAECIPQTNPFLRDIFQQLAGFDISKSIVDIVDDLVDIFAATDVDKLRKNISKEMEKHDPMILFYEDFLEQYNPAARKKYGVYYTPQPVVEFIVRAVDDILKSEFGIADGLADICKVDIDVQKPEEGKDIASTRTENLHRVQILDPATGTGTFLAEVVSRIKEKQQKGVWPKYVEEHLIPRIFGFEYMMAPYTIAHLKLDMLINWWEGEKITDDHKERLNIYLTNSLDQTDLLDTKHSFATMIAEEANKANYYKHNAPVMVMLGNPPYSVSSSNKSEWILELLDDYKKNLNERNIQPLSDDYIKFIRLGQYYIERTGEGVLAYISNNSFLEGQIHRQMRRELLRCFDDIYILDLHGNNRKKESAPDGGKDENVFDIMQGVNISIFIKKKNGEDRSAVVHHADVFGLRKEKYKFLRDNTLSTIKWRIVQTLEPTYFFVPKDFSAKEEYNRGFPVDELMSKNACGIVSSRDSILIKDSKEELNGIISDFQNLTEFEFREKYSIKDSRDWTYIGAKKEIRNASIIPIEYRPFDIQFVIYSSKSKGILSYPRYEIMQHIIEKPNLVLNICKYQSTYDFQHVLASEYITDKCTVSAQGSEAGYAFPLFLYPSNILGVQQSRKVNLNDSIWWTIENWVKYGQAYPPLTSSEKGGELGFDAAPKEPHFLEPEDIFDYIYGVLHSPAYREKYKEFLKIDFPRIPYPKNEEEFEHYKDCGHRLRELHLMHKVPKSPVTFEGFGNYEVTQLVLKGNNVYINDKQYFTNVPQEAWDFYIGGYQPAQKWLKDRKGRTLDTADIDHYEKIISVLLETARIMKQIDDRVYPELVDELKHKVQDLEHQLQAQQSGQGLKVIGGNVTYIDNSTNYNIKK